MIFDVLIQQLSRRTARASCARFSGPYIGVWRDDSGQDPLMIFDTFIWLVPLPTPTDELKRVPTFSGAKALPVYPTEQAGQARASCARFSGPYIQVGTRFSASVVPHPHTTGLISQQPSARPLRLHHPSLDNLVNNHQRIRFCVCYLSSTHAKNDRHPRHFCDTLNKPKPYPMQIML